MNSEQKHEIEKIIDNLIGISNGVKNKIITNGELQSSTSLALSDVYNTLEEGSFEYRKFDSFKIDNFGITSWSKGRDLYLKQYASDSTNIDKIISFLQELSLYKKVESENHFSKDDEYTARRFLGKLLSSAQKEILILDNYFDSNIFDFIEEINKDIGIKLLTSFNGAKKQFKELVKLYGKDNLEVRYLSVDNHARHILIDMKDLYLMDCSFNTMGKKGFTIKKLDNTDKAEELMSLWNESKKRED